MSTNTEDIIITKKVDNRITIVVLILLVASFMATTKTVRLYSADKKQSGVTSEEILEENGLDWEYEVPPNPEDSIIEMEKYPIEVRKATAQAVLIAGDDVPPEVMAAFRKILNDDAAAKKEKENNSSK